MLGAARAEVVGRPVEALLEPSSRERFAHVWQAFRAGGGHAEPFALEAPATRGRGGGDGDRASVLPSRHLITLDPASGAGAPDEPPSPRAPLRRSGRRRRARTPTARELRGARAARRRAHRRADRRPCSSLSPATVQTHVRNAKAKLGARTRAQAVAIALQRGLIEPAQPRRRAAAADAELGERARTRVERVELERDPDLVAGHGAGRCRPAARRAGSGSPTPRAARRRPRGARQRPLAIAGGAGDRALGEQRQCR